jgi:hypothetical protein
LVETSHHGARVAVAMEAEKFRLARARALSRVGVDHVALRTNLPYAETLHRTFAERARRLRR